VALKPSALGGANWPPSSYDPTTNYLYVCANEGVQFLRSGGDETRIVDEGKSYSGSTFGEFPLGFSGVFATVDLRTNRLVWRQAWQAPCFSGSVTTAGGLVFVGRNDGRLTALDSSNGNRLWEFQTGAGVNAPASVFEFEGVEYVAVYSAGNALIGSQHGDSLWLFSLHGTLKPPDSEQETPPPANVAAEAADPERGRKIFEDSCSACHGASGKGGHGPPLSDTRDIEVITQVVRSGRAQMPAFASRLSEQQIRDVAAYVRDRLIR
jgi:cytochrome c553